MKNQVFSTSWPSSSSEVHVDDDVAGEELASWSRSSCRGGFRRPFRSARAPRRCSRSCPRLPTVRRMRSRTFSSWPERTWTTYHWSRNGLVSDMTGRSEMDEADADADQRPRLVKKRHDQHVEEIPELDETREQDHRDQHHDGRIHQFLVFLKPLIFGSDSQGQLALRSSPLTSPRKLEIFENMMR